MGYFRFKKKHDFYKRLDESYRIKTKYPDKVPIIVEKQKSSTDIPDIDRSKYLVPNDITMAEFMYVIRKRLKLDAYQSIYLFVDDTVLVPSCDIMSSVYDRFKDDDQFLYIKYTGENTFG